MQVALYAAAELGPRVRGVTLLNCSGAMNQRGLYQDDATLAALKPVFWVVESLLKRKGIATWLFEKFRYGGASIRWEVTPAQPGHWCQ